MNFNCVVVGVYAGRSAAESRILLEELILFKNAFELPIFVAGDFNETLFSNKRSSGYLNITSSTAFWTFISDCNLLEYPLFGYRYSLFRGRSMSHIDRAFAA